MRTIETDRFGCTVSERAAFEAGIKLGTIYHQFIGTPVSPESRQDLEEAIRSAVLSQPHVKNAEISIPEAALENEMGVAGYVSLNERMIVASIIIDVEGTLCRARLEWSGEMDYPLMWVESITKGI
jgi:hypothetical protein